MRKKSMKSCTFSKEYWDAPLKILKRQLCNKKKTSQYLASISEMKDDLFSVQALLDSVNMRNKENTLIRDLTIGERKIIALIKFVVCNKSRCVLQNLFLGMSEMEVKKANVLLVEISTYTDVYLIEPTTYGFEICDRIEYLSDNQ